MKKLSSLKLAFHLFLAFLPIFAGSLRQEWWVVSIIIGNAFFQGSFMFFYKKNDQ